MGKQGRKKNTHTHTDVSILQAFLMTSHTHPANQLARSVLDSLDLTVGLHAPLSEEKSEENSAQEAASEPGGRAGGRCGWLLHYRLLLMLAKVRVHHLERMQTRRSSFSSKFVFASPASEWWARVLLRLQTRHAGRLVVSLGAGVSTGSLCTPQPGLTSPKHLLSSHLVARPSPDPHVDEGVVNTDDDDVYANIFSATAATVLAQGRASVLVTKNAAASATAATVAGLTTLVEMAGVLESEDSLEITSFDDLAPAARLAYIAQDAVLAYIQLQTADGVVTSKAKFAKEGRKLLFRVIPSASCKDEDRRHHYCLALRLLYDLLPPLAQAPLSFAGLLPVERVLAAFLPRGLKYAVSLVKRAQVSDLWAVKALGQVVGCHVLRADLLGTGRLLSFWLQQLCSTDIGHHFHTFSHIFAHLRTFYLFYAYKFE